MSPLQILALIVGLGAGALLALGLRRPVFILVPAGGYLALISVAGRRIARGAAVPPATTIAALATLHLAYGCGLLGGVARGLVRARRT